MDLFINLCGFFGVWLLFIFPLYQACLELAAQAIEFKQFSDSKIEVKEISPFYWIIPPYKIYKEKHRAILILKKLDLNTNELYKIMNFFDKATAWFYVSLAGLLNSIYVTHELFEKYEMYNPYYFFIFIIVMTVFGILHVHFRMNKKRIDRKINSLG